jgi:hypothetical protein
VCLVLPKQGVHHSVRQKVLAGPPAAEERSTAGRLVASQRGQPDHILGAQPLQRRRETNLAQQSLLVRKGRIGAEIGVDQLGGHREEALSRDVMAGWNMAMTHLFTPVRGATCALA